MDLRKLKTLIELVETSGIAELEIQEGEERVRITRARPPAPSTYLVPGAAPSPGAAPAFPGERPPPAASGAVPNAEAPASHAPEGHLVKSPMVGTFYSSANPAAPPFVMIGDQVGPETTVCIVEAMKVFNEIPAECSGRIVAVLAQNGDAVEFNQPLFRVDPASCRPFNRFPAAFYAPALAVDVPTHPDRKSW